MKLSQLLHKLSPNQLLIITDHANKQPRTILARGNRSAIPKDSTLNNATVCTIDYSQAHMIISVLQQNNI